MGEMSAIRTLLKNGYCVEIGKLSICRVNDYINRPQEEYLVEFRGNDSRVPQALLFKNVNKAIIEFLNIKRKKYGDDTKWKL